VEVKLHALLNSTLDRGSNFDQFHFGELVTRYPLIEQEAGWAPEPVRTWWRTEKPLPLPGAELRPSVSKSFTSLTKISRLIMAINDEYTRITKMLVKAVDPTRWSETSSNMIPDLHRD
jgi:hypothetical protein